MLAGQDSNPVSQPDRIGILSYETLDVYGETPVRVALLSYNARPGDAIGNQVAAKFRFFRERAAEVRVFLESDRPVHPDLAGHYSLLRSSDPAKEPWRYLTGCDLVVAEYGQHYSLLDLLPLLADGKPRIMVDYHGVTPPELWGPHNRAALESGVRQRGLACFADVVLVHSQFTHRELQRECRLPAERLCQLGYIVEMPSAACGLAPNRLRRSLGLEQATVLLYVGRLAANKRVPVLIEGLHRLRDVDPPVHLLIVGDDLDMYQQEAERCRARARELGIAERVHFLGQRVGRTLAEAYAAADVFVTASAWESFCIPVVEAMACGVPVVAARTTALPDTTADAGLTFTADDADDLAAVLRRLLQKHVRFIKEGERGCVNAPSLECSNTRGAHATRLADTRGAHATPLADTRGAHATPLAQTQGADATPLAGRQMKIAVICLHSENRQINGAARSLRTIAEALRRAGLEVEWLAAEADRPIHHAGEGKDEAFLAELPFSETLLAEVQRRAANLDAIIIGPYLSRLTFEIARQFPEKTLLLPCFHEEPAARLSLWHNAYQRVGAFLYHSAAEQTLAQSDLGFNHPNAVVVGTLLRSPQLERGKTPFAHASGSDSQRYVAYCGRYTAEKNLLLLLEFARRYQGERPGRFQFVFMGVGNVPIPKVSWARDLGMVSEAVKSEVLAGAEALLHLSQRESLSLAALEAWQAGTPVIANAGCAVLAAAIAQTGGGATIGDYKGFARTLDDLWDHPDAWRDRGQRGQAWVRDQFQCEEKFAAQLGKALAAMTVPIYQQLQEKGVQRAQQFSEQAWQQNFAAAVERALHREREDQPFRVEVRRRVASRQVTPDCRRILVPVRVHNWGTHPAVADGPGRVVICTQVLDEHSGEWIGEPAITPLPRLVIPGEKTAAAVTVSVPERNGRFQVWFWAQPEHRLGERGCVSAPSLESPELGALTRPRSPNCEARTPEDSRLASSMRLVVGASNEVSPQACGLLLGTVQQDLAEADRLQRLPDDYLDVTQGTLAKIKQRIKQKLLHNFRVAYVDVLSRQQSAFNRQVLSVVQELAECCALLDHAVQQLQQTRPRTRKKRRKQQQEN